MFQTYERCVVGAFLHLQFTPAYSLNIFCDAVLIRFCRLEFQRIARKLGVSVVACAFDPNHTHVFIRGWKNYAIAYLAQRFKGGSSHYLRENFLERVKTKLWGDKFWTEGYFAETVGRITTRKMEYYIERQPRQVSPLETCLRMGHPRTGQSKHWTGKDYKIYMEPTKTLNPKHT